MNNKNKTLFQNKVEGNYWHPSGSSKFQMHTTVCMCAVARTYTHLCIQTYMHIICTHIYIIYVQRYIFLKKKDLCAMRTVRRSWVGEPASINSLVSEIDLSASNSNISNHWECVINYLFTGHVCRKCSDKSVHIVWKLWTSYRINWPEYCYDLT